MPANPNKLSQFWQELKRRKVIRVVIVYAAAGFAVIEFVDIVTEPLNLPEWALTLVIILVAIGFPLAIILAWAYDITPSGIEKTKSLDAFKEQDKNRIHADKTSRFENSIAVLPFEDMSPQKDQEYFCDGMTEEIINALTHVESLKVIARTSSFAFKGKQKDMREIGRKLDVETLLEGSIRKDGKQLRITAQLIKVTDGSHIWSEKFDREMVDIFAIQDEISQAIVDNLEVKLLLKKNEPILKHHTEDLAAYNLYLKGRYLINLLSEENFKKGLECFNQAIALDPGYALAYTGIANYYTYLGWYSILSPDQAFEKAKDYAEKALKLDKLLPQAHYLIAVLKFVRDWNWDEAEKGFEYALRLDPGNTSSFMYYSCFFVCMCRYDEAVKISKRFVELDPLSPVTNLILGWVYFEAERYDESIEQLRTVLELNPGFIIAQQEIAWNYAFKGMCKEAMSEYQKMGDQDMGVTWGDTTRAIIHGLCGEKDEVQKTYDKLKKISEERYIDYSYLAVLSGFLGDIDQAFDWLDKAYEERSVFMVYLKNYKKSWFQSISSDSRFKTLMKKVGFEE
jgi:TolB-like protein/Tfp pilus assembly protein PilF